jgi:hypothetical protein
MPCPGCCPLIRRSAAQPVDPACFSRRQNRCEHRLAATRSGMPVTGASLSCIQRPNPSSGPFPTPFFTPRFALNSGHKHPHPAASTGRRSGYSGTLLGATGGNQKTLAPNRSKARQLLDARQGLVRVPESNTKYGGKRRKTGDGTTPVSWASISESSGIPKAKICCPAWESRLLPLFTGQLFLGVSGLRLGDSRKATESARLFPCRAA